jgi:hypothetical protein
MGLTASGLLLIHLVSTEQRRTIDRCEAARMPMIRHIQALVLALVSAAMLGCFTAQPDRATSRYQSRMPYDGPMGENTVQLLVALVERPLGDHTLNQEIWELVDEQGLDLEQKVRLHENGLRMGQFGSQPPGSLRELICSERSCANPRRIKMISGNSTTLLLGPTQSHCTFNLVANGQPNLVELDQALCQFQIVPTLAPDGGTRLQITPIIKHGQTTLEPRSVKDPSGTLRWELLPEQPVETYADLSWQQTVGENEYLVIGAWLDRPDTLGQRCFIQSDTDAPIQRVLVLRALRGGVEAIPPDDLLNKSPPIAAQASLPTIRGVQP